LFFALPRGRQTRPRQQKTYEGGIQRLRRLEEKLMPAVETEFDRQRAHGLKQAATPELNSV
jgi:hypothetical protein